MHEHLGCDVPWRAARGLHDNLPCGVVGEDLTQAEVGNLDGCRIGRVLQQDVLGFEVAMGHVIRVQVLYGLQQRLGDLPCIFL